MGTHYSATVESRTSSVSDRLRELEPRLRRIQENTGMPGMSIGVIHQGMEVWKFNAGASDVENDIPTQSDTVFDLNSLTEGLTAAAFACLVRDGKMTWATHIRSVLSDFAEGGDVLDKSITPID